MSLYESLRDLSLEIEDLSLRLNERQVSRDFTRVTTEIHLSGGGETGIGEDVTYAEEHHYAQEEREGSIDLSGDYIFDDFSRKIGGLDLFPEGPERPFFRNYRRWGFESAALDLALRQNGTNLGDAVGRSYSPVRFVVSPRLGFPPDTEIVERWMEAVPDIELKLDAHVSWNEETVEELPVDSVRVVDLKGLYDDVEVQQPPDPGLYRLVVDGFPEAIIEDPKVTDETRPILEPERHRVSWDKPIDGVESLHDQPFEPDVVNVKPSRFGSVENLLETVEHCEENGIEMYGGGQFELGPGRGHVQTLASLFYPDSPNDVSPRDYFIAEASDDVPSSPVEPAGEPEGLGFR